MQNHWAIMAAEVKWKTLIISLEWERVGWIMQVNTLPLKQIHYKFIKMGKNQNLNDSDKLHWQDSYIAHSQLQVLQSISSLRWFGPPKKGQRKEKYSSMTVKGIQCLLKNAWTKGPEEKKLKLK